MGHLADQTNAADTYEALESVPRTLQERYEKAITRLKTHVNSKVSERSILAMRILAWISHAKRPLLATELCHALAVRTGDTALRPSRFPTRDTLTHL